MNPWEHAAIIVGGIAAIAVGFIDINLARHLTAGVDVGLIVTGLSALGVKATGVLP